MGMALRLLLCGHYRLRKPETSIRIALPQHSGQPPDWQFANSETGKITTIYRDKNEILHNI
jgi:hypothetical protein